MVVLALGLTGLPVVAEVVDDHAASHSIEHVEGPVHATSSFGGAATYIEGPVLLSAQS